MGYIPGTHAIGVERHRAWHARRRRLIPVVEQHPVSAGTARLRRVDRLAGELRREQPDLVPEAWVRRLQPETLDDGASLVLCDQSGIPLMGRFTDASHLQDRSVLRAVGGDLVATCTPHDPAYADYCARRLGLGVVTWLHPRASGTRLRVASACWRDLHVRHTVLRALRAGSLDYVHPYIGSLEVWALARLCTRAARRPLRVIGPPPILTRRANDKVWLADVLTRLFGERIVPQTRHAWNLATAARLARELATDALTVVLKVPEASGSAGNVLLQASELRGQPLASIRSLVQERLAPLGWAGERLLVGSWERKVLLSPSVQTWIPPLGTRDPVVEGIFEQTLTKEVGRFRGAAPAALPQGVRDEIAERSWLVALLFQRLGYVGRCSFDLILVGESLSRCQVLFVECNGRWGGASLPMTLMTRLFGRWNAHPYAAREVQVPGLDRLAFADVLDGLDDGLYDAASGRGRVIVYNPHHLRAAGTLDAIVLGRSWAEARRWLDEELPRRLTDLVRKAVSPARRSRPAARRRWVGPRLVS
jgi:hypothetical protein